jgi:hypothetical protein
VIWTREGILPLKNKKESNCVYYSARKGEATNWCTML